MSDPPLKFLVDAGVGRKIENYLSKNGYDLVAIRDINPCMSDSEIINLAVQKKRIIITMDKDFGELVYHSGCAHRGVLLLRTENCTGEEKVRILSKILLKHSIELIDNFCVFSKDRLRIRKIRY